MGQEEGPEGVRTAEEDACTTMQSTFHQISPDLHTHRDYGHPSTFSNSFNIIQKLWKDRVCKSPDVT